MARGSTLESILADLNNEVGNIETPSYGIGARSALITTLQRTQEWLWEEHDWPFLQVKKDIQLQAGSRYYDMPTGIDITRIQKVQTKYAGYWQDVDFGIEEDLHYPEFDSDIGERYDPAFRWDFYYDTENNAEQLEVWPIPATDFNATTFNGALRVTAIRTLSNFTAESDTADLDDKLIVLFAAAELLARDRTDDAAAKLDAANKLFNRLKSHTAKTGSFSLGSMDSDGEGDCHRRTRIRAVYGNTSGA